MQNIFNDIKFDRYGDITFFGNDIDIIDEQNDILYQNILDRLITNHGDYKLYPSLGANISRQIGKSVTPELEETIKNNVINTLTYDNFLLSSEFTVTTYSRRDKILLKVTVFNTSRLGLEERFEVNSIFHTSSGMIYAAD